MNESLRQWHARAEPNRRRRGRRRHHRRPLALWLEAAATREITANRGEQYETMRDRARRSTFKRSVNEMNG